MGYSFETCASSIGLTESIRCEKERVMNIFASCSRNLNARQSLSVFADFAASIVPVALWHLSCFESYGAR